MYSCSKIHRYQNAINQGGHPIALVSMVTTLCEKSLYPVSSLQVEARTNVMFVCWPKALPLWVLPPGGLSESPKFTKISCKPGHGLSRKKKNTLPVHVSQGTERMRLVLSSSWAFWYRCFSLCKKTPHTYPTHYTHAYTFNSERELSCLVRCCRPRGRWSGSEESRELVALFGKTCRSGTAGCSRPAALTFRKCSKVAEARTAQVCSRAFMIRVLELDLSLDLISKTPLRSYWPTCCRENT